MSLAQLSELSSRFNINRHIVALAVLTLTGGVLAFVIGWKPYGAWDAHDPHVYYENARAILSGDYPNTERLSTQQDPPLRYLPLVLIYLVVDSTTALGSRMVSLHVAWFATVFVPLSIYSLARQLFDRRRGLVAMGAALGLHALQAAYNGYYGGQFQDLLVLPFCYVGLAVLYRPRRFGVIVAGCLVLAALTQVMAAAFTAGIVAMALLSWGSFRALGWTAGISILGASPLLVLPRFIKYLYLWTFDAIIPFEALNAYYTGEGLLRSFLAPYTHEHILSALTEPIFWVLMLSSLTLVAGVRYRAPSFDARTIIESAFLFVVIVYPLWKLGTWGYVHRVFETYFTPLAVTLLAAWCSYYRSVLLAGLRERWAARGVGRRGGAD